MALRKGITFPGTTPHPIYIICLVHICTLYLKKERPDKILFYIIF